MIVLALRHGHGAPPSSACCPATARPRRAARRPAAGRAPRPRRAPARAAPTRLLARRGRRLGRRRAHRRRRRAGHVHRPAHRRRHRPRARAGARRGRSSASRRCGARRGRDAATPAPCSPVIDARRGEAFAAACARRRAAARPGRARARGAGRALADARAAPGWPSATGRYDSGSCSSGPGPRSRRTDRRSTASAPLRAVPARRPRGDRSDRDAARPGLPARARTPSRHRSPAPPPHDATIDIRRLTYADLPQVIAIERRAFPTPWSLAMFVLELSKPAGICLAARRRRRARRLPRLLALRHGLARDERRRRPRPPPRRASPPRCSSALFERVGDDDARFTLEVRPLQRRRDRALRALRLPRAPGVRRRYYQDNGEDALIMWRTPATLRGTPRRRPQRRPPR